MKTLNCGRYICSTVFWPSKEEIVSYTAVIYRDAQNICWHLCMVLLLAENKHKEMTDKPKGGHVVFAWMCVNEISQYPSAVTMSGWLRINRGVVFYRLFWGKFSLGQLGLTLSIAVVDSNWLQHRIMTQRKKASCLFLGELRKKLVKLIVKKKETKTIHWTKHSLTIAQMQIMVIEKRCSVGTIYELNISENPIEFCVLVL